MQAATPPPAPRDGPWLTAPIALRFEDVAQDGRVILEALPNALEPTIWRHLREHDVGARACFANGVVPILRRLSLEGAPGPFSPHVPVEARATWALARADSGQFVLDMWAELYARSARTYGPPVPGSETEALVGRVYAEHVLTRPFAGPGQRRVSRLDFEGAPVIAESRPALAPAETLASVPDGGRALDPRPAVDPLPVVFGLLHTDSNLHVNSLAYVRLFEEAALRRFHARGVEATRLGRRIEIAYRKPCFAGQVLRLAIQAYERGGHLGAVGMLVGAPDASGDEGAIRARARAVVRIDFEE